MNLIAFLLWLTAVVLCLVETSQKVKCRPLLPLSLALFIAGFAVNFIFPSTYVHGHG